MSREILDDVVKENLQKFNTPLSMFDSLPQYQGEVKTKLERVKLDESENGLSSVSIEDLLKSTMMKFQITEEICIFQIGEKEYQISNEMCRFLKSLLFTQVSENMEFSQAVAKCFYAAMKQLMQTGEINSIPIDVAGSLFEQHVMSRVDDLLKVVNTK